MVFFSINARRNKQRSLPTILLATALPALYGCTVGPDYQPPEINAPSSFESSPDLPTLIESHGEQLGEKSADLSKLRADWWEGFSDELLNSLVSSALQDNFELKEARAGVEEAAARFSLVDAQDRPAVIFNGETGLSLREDLGGSSSSQTTRSASGFLTLAFPLDIFGQNKRSEEIARAELEAAYADYLAVLLRISAEVTSEYLLIRGNQQQLNLLRESVKLQERTLQIVQSRYQSGLSPELDVRRAEAAVENLRADIPLLEERLTRSRHRLSTLLGAFHVVKASVVEQSAGIPQFKDDLPRLIPLEVLRLRPDVARAEADLKRATAAIGVAAAEWYPFFDIFGRIGIGVDGINGRPSVELLLGNLALALQQTIYDGGARKARLSIAQAQTDAALAGYRRTLLEAVEEIEGILAGLRASIVRQEALRKTVTASERSFFQAEILYRQGLTSFLDVVDAQRVLASAQQQLARAETDYAVQIANFFQALGTGEPTQNAHAQL